MKFNKRLMRISRSRQKKLRCQSSNKDKSMGNNDKINEQSDNQNDVQYRKCMETCSACTEKDENLKSRNAEFTKIQKSFQNICKEMLENENALKQKEEELTQKCKILKKKMRF
ncbi:hypothetical protein Hanom_Chr12g01117601 [Helianthus anomalus]